MAHVTFVHGICNKPPKDELRQLWEEAIKEDDGLNLGASGISTSMVYWAHILYPEPATPDQVHEAAGLEIAVSASDEDLCWIQELDPHERKVVLALAERMGFDTESPAGDDFTAPAEDEDGSFERVPLPWGLKRPIMKAFLRDVHHYLFNAESRPRTGEVYRVQDTIRKLFVEQLIQDRQDNPDGPHVLVSHSMGTVISYDCLKRVPDCPPIDGFMTIGSPLGLDEIQDLLKPEWTREDGFPSLKVGGRWINVFDRLDVVAAFDTRIGNDYRQSGVATIDDVAVKNSGKWRHDIREYLNREELRSGLSALIDR